MCRCHGQVFCALTALAIVANVQLGTTRYIVILCLYSALRFPIVFQDGGQHFDDDCSTLMMIASSVVSTLMMIASSVGQHFDDDCIFGQRTWKKFGF